jgi:predicted  nucleic acid-binding Zn-ribbon protein
MVDTQIDQIQFLLSDFNTRLRDIDERNKLVRERVLLLGKSLLNSKQETEEAIKELKKESLELRKEVEKLKKISNSLLSEFGRFVKQEEVMVIERMLKDFQPLEFMRRKDVEELIDNKLGSFSHQETNKKYKHHS